MYEGICKSLYGTDSSKAHNIKVAISVLENISDGTTALYEVKSSTSVKTDNKHNHIKDACFQKICAERAGKKIARLSPIENEVPRTRGKLDFRKAAGLGKEIWKDIDVDAYLRREREEWV